MTQGTSDTHSFLYPELVDDRGTYNLFPPSRSTDPSQYTKPLRDFLDCSSDQAMVFDEIATTLSRKDRSAFEQLSFFPPLLSLEQTNGQSPFVPPKSYVDLGILPVDNRLHATEGEATSPTNSHAPPLGVFRYGLGADEVPFGPTCTAPFPSRQLNPLPTADLRPQTRLVVSSHHNNSNGRSQQPVSTARPSLFYEPNPLFAPMSESSWSPLMLPVQSFPDSSTSISTAFSYTRDHAVTHQPGMHSSILQSSQATGLSVTDQRVPCSQTHSEPLLVFYPVHGKPPIIPKGVKQSIRITPQRNEPLHSSTSGSIKGAPKQTEVKSEQTAIQVPQVPFQRKRTRSNKSNDKNSEVKTAASFPQGTVKVVKKRLPPSKSRKRMSEKQRLHQTVQEQTNYIARLEAKLDLLSAQSEVNARIVASAQRALSREQYQRLLDMSGAQTNVSSATT